MGNLNFYEVDGDYLTFLQERERAQGDLQRFLIIFMILMKSLCVGLFYRLMG